MLRVGGATHPFSNSVVCWYSSSFALALCISPVGIRNHLVALYHRFNLWSSVFMSLHFWSYHWLQGNCLTLCLDYFLHKTLSAASSIPLSTVKESRSCALNNVMSMRQVLIITIRRAQVVSTEQQLGRIWVPKAMLWNSSGWQWEKCRQHKRTSAFKHAYAGVL